MQDKTRLGRILDPFLRKYDHHGEGRIDLTQMHALLADVHEAVPPAEVQRWVARLDPGGRGSIETSGLVDAMLHSITTHTVEAMEAEAAYPPTTYVPPAVTPAAPPSEPSAERTAGVAG